MPILDHAESQGLSEIPIEASILLLGPLCSSAKNLKKKTA